MKKIIWALILVGVLFFFAKGWWNNQFKSVSSDTKLQVFVVQKGASVSEIAKKLKADNLIKSELAFKYYLKQNNLGDKIQAGSYKLSPSMDMKELLSKMQTGSEDTWVTLLEGWRNEEIADKLNQELKISKDDFLKKAKQGYMFPDTYLFPKEATISYIVDTLENTFDNRFNDDLKSKIKSKGLTPEQGVVLASIVEREGRSQKVRTEIAGVLLKRLNIGMALNVDASLQYILGYQKDEKSWWKRNLTNEDKKVESPYNTYLHAGLPPKPICNPSLSSLQAVADANPNTPYLYYYHDSKGNSYYGKTLEEHNENVANHP
jgi:UPF0755 protein